MDVVYLFNFPYRPHIVSPQASRLGRLSEMEHRVCVPCSCKQGKEFALSIMIPSIILRSHTFSHMELIQKTKCIYPFL